jgi:hypothetical protein
VPWLAQGGGENWQGHAQNARWVAGYHALCGEVSPRVCATSRLFTAPGSQRSKFNSRPREMRCGVSYRRFFKDSTTKICNCSYIHIYIYTCTRPEWVLHTQRGIALLVRRVFGKLAVDRVLTRPRSSPGNGDQPTPANGAQPASLPNPRERTVGLSYVMDFVSTHSCGKIMAFSFRKILVSGFLIFSIVAA